MFTIEKSDLPGSYYIIKFGSGHVGVTNDLDFAKASAQAYIENIVCKSFEPYHGFD